jgi:hypothetical protein
LRLLRLLRLFGASAAAALRTRHKIVIKTSARAKDIPGV